MSVQRQMRRKNQLAFEKDAEKVRKEYIRSHNRLCFMPFKVRWALAWKIIFKTVLPE